MRTLADQSTIDPTFGDVLLACVGIIALMIAGRWVIERIRRWWTHHCCVICGVWLRGPSRGRNRTCTYCLENAR
ncbi:MAG: hypothetical protein IPL80_19830 [Sterolibacteriaceae bacterium]|nr:hypothetical protein [Sterolibacteriaceae bacterium]